MIACQCIAFLHTVRHSCMFACRLHDMGYKLSFLVMMYAWLPEVGIHTDGRLIPDWFYPRLYSPEVKGLTPRSVQIPCWRMMARDGLFLLRIYKWPQWDRWNVQLHPRIFISSRRSPRLVSETRLLFDHTDLITILCLLVIMLRCCTTLPLIWSLEPGSELVSAHADHRHVRSASWYQSAVRSTYKDTACQLALLEQPHWWVLWCRDFILHVLG